jgi:hypothetical protein
MSMLLQVFIVDRRETTSRRIAAWLALGLVRFCAMSRSTSVVCEWMSGRLWIA